MATNNDANNGNMQLGQAWKVACNATNNDENMNVNIQGKLGKIACKETHDDDDNMLTMNYD